MSVAQGYYFGEVDLLFGEVRKFTYICDDDVELLSLSKRDFTKVFFQDFPTIGSLIYKNALKRKISSIKS
jgi:CRP-like cAMP-binding protein